MNPYARKQIAYIANGWLEYQEQLLFYNRICSLDK